MRSESQKVHERLERLELSTPIRARDTKHIIFDDLEEEAAEEGSTHANKSKSKDKNLGSIKIKISAFQGKSDPEAYLEREKKVKRVFDYYNFTEEKKKDKVGSRGVH